MEWSQFLYAFRTLKDNEATKSQKRVNEIKDYKKFMQLATFFMDQSVVQFKILEKLYLYFSNNSNHRLYVYDKKNNICEILFCFDLIMKMSGIYKSFCICNCRCFYKKLLTYFLRNHNTLYVEGFGNRFDNFRKLVRHTSSVLSTVDVSTYTAFLLCDSIYNQYTISHLCICKCCNRICIKMLDSKREAILMQGLTSDKSKQKLRKQILNLANKFLSIRRILISTILYLLEQNIQHVLGFHEDKLNCLLNFVL